MHAGKQTQVGKLAESDTRKHELPVHGAGATGDDAASAKADGRRVAGKLRQLLTSDLTLFGAELLVIGLALVLGAPGRKFADKLFTLCLAIDHTGLGHQFLDGEISTPPVYRFGERCQP